MYPQRACPHPYGSFVANGCDIFLVFQTAGLAEKIRRPRSGIQRFPRKNGADAARKGPLSGCVGSWKNTPYVRSVGGVLRHNRFVVRGRGEIGIQNRNTDVCQIAALRALFHIDCDGDLRIVRRGVENERGVV